MSEDDDLGYERPTFNFKDFVYFFSEVMTSCSLISSA